MKVTVKLFALLGQYLPPNAKNNQVDLDVEEGTTPEAVFARLNVSPGQRGTHVLNDKDVLAVWPPVAGGNSL